MELCTDLRIVEVAGLPGFHNPFRCEQRAVFDAAVLEALAARRRPWQFWKPSVQELVQHLPAEVSERLMRGVRDRLGPRRAGGLPPGLRLPPARLDHHRPPRMRAR